jgi:hypothetical protein
MAIRMVNMGGDIREVSSSLIQFFRIAFLFSISSTYTLRASLVTLGYMQL